MPERATPVPAGPGPGRGQQVGVGGAVPEYAGDEEEEEEGGWAGGGSNERSLLGSQGAGALAYARGEARDMEEGEGGERQRGSVHGLCICVCGGGGCVRAFVRVCYGEAATGQ